MSTIVEELTVSYCDIQVFRYGKPKSSLWSVKSRLIIPSCMAENDSPDDIMCVLGQYVWLNLIDSVEVSHRICQDLGVCQRYIANYTLTQWHELEARPESIVDYWSSVFNTAVSDSLFKPAIPHYLREVLHEGAY